MLVVAMGLGGSVAGAKKKHKKKGKARGSEVTLSKASTTQFKGVVSSKLGACRGSRVVTLFYTDPNSGQASPLSVQRTDGNGGFQVTLTTPAFAGTYQVEVAQRKIRAMKAPQTCQSATSPVVTV
jgi:hypothetical protein